MRALPGTRRLWGNLADQLARGIAKIRPEKSLGTRNAVKTSEPLSWVGVWIDTSIRCHIHSDMLTTRTSPQLYLLRQVRLCSNERHSAHGRSPAGTRECLACTWPRMPGYLWPSNAAALPQRAGLLGLVSAARAQRLVPVEPARQRASMHVESWRRAHLISIR